jgi:hypothetical protein
MSQRRQLEAPKYRALRSEFLSEHPLCEAKLSGCAYWSCDVHHTAGRGRFLLAVETWLAACRSCHDWIERHRRQARELGLIVRY